MNAASCREALDSLAGRRLGMVALRQRASGVWVPRVAGGGQQVRLDGASGSWLAFGALSVVRHRVEVLIYDRDQAGAARAVALRVAQRCGLDCAERVLAQADKQLQEVR